MTPTLIAFSMGWFGGFLVCGFCREGWTKAAIAVFIIVPPLSTVLEHLASNP